MLSPHPLIAVGGVGAQQGAEVRSVRDTNHPPKARKRLSAGHFHDLLHGIDTSLEGMPYHHQEGIPITVTFDE